MTAVLAVLSVSALAAESPRTGTASVADDRLGASKDEVVPTPAAAEPAAGPTDPPLAKELAYPLGTLSSPSAGQTLRPGDVVSVTVAALPGMDLANALVGAVPGGATEYHETFPATLQFTVPMDAAGTFTVVAMCDDSSGALAPTLELHFPVVPSATLTGMTAVPSPIELEPPGDYAVLRVTGHYTDGVDRDVTPAAAGTTYASGDTAVVTATADGRVTAVGDGQTTITVQNAGVLVEVPVDVDHTRYH